MGIRNSNSEQEMETRKIHLSPESQKENSWKVAKVGFWSKGYKL